jgi:16S rRNA (uracil1498-N3)-methyltransferase
LGAETESNEAGFRLELWVAPARPQRAAWLVEKATEIGVVAIRWLDSGRSGRQVPTTRLARLRRVAEAAVEQCHRASIPEITGLHSWQEAIDCIGASGASWFLDIAGRSTVDAASGKSGALFVGPEGGWSERERDDLVGAGCRPVGLGPRHLRLETAAIAGCALLLSICGD